MGNKNMHGIGKMTYQVDNENLIEVNLINYVN